VRPRSKTANPDDVGVAFFRLGCLMRKKGGEEDAAVFEKQAADVFKSVADQRGDIQEEDIINGKAISKPPPAYPVEARQRRQQGEVTVRLLVGETGTVLAACAEGKYKSLNRVAEFAAYGARFTPTRVRGRQVKVRGVITYNFVLR
ncbi:MAG: energy transducer TonB, partial [Pyrinomonadaceae bacterium]